MRSIKSTRKRNLINFYDPFTDNYEDFFSRYNFLDLMQDFVDK